MRGPTGVFTISLDTELAWGMFDLGRVDEFEDAYRRTPDVIERLCELFDEYEIPATWALVSHLLTDCEEGRRHGGRTTPDFDWIEDWFEELPCVTDQSADLWHAPWLVERLRACETEQEIGLHGSTHMQIGAAGCTKQVASEELGEAVETLESQGIEPESFVFPRNDVGHVDVLGEYGIRVYRGVDARWYERSAVMESLRPPLRFAEEAIRRTPPIVGIKEREGVVEIPGSQFFKPSHGGWQYTPGDTVVARAKKGLRRAAAMGGVFHLWFHPFNLGHEPERDLGRLEEVLSFASRLMDAGRLVAAPMKDLPDVVASNPGHQRN